MKNYLCLLFLLSALPFGHAQSTHAPDRLILRWHQLDDFQPASTLQRQVFGNEVVDALIASWGESRISRAGHPDDQHTYLLQFDPSTEVWEKILQLQQTGYFRYVEPDFIGYGQSAMDTFPNDPEFFLQHGCYNDGVDWTFLTLKEDADMDMELAWDVERGSDKIVVAILDSGAKLDHTDLADRIYVNPQEMANGIDDDNNGFVDDRHGWDFVNNDNDPTDDHGHGTKVSGLIGASTNNAYGMAGIDWHCQLMQCKVLNQNNFGFYTWWAAAIYYAVDNGADVICLAAGGVDYSSLLKEAVDYAVSNGVTLISSVGTLDNNQPFYPSAYPNAIAVGATDPEDLRAAPFMFLTSGGSNYGDFLDVVAPGDFVYSLSHTDNGIDYQWEGGTSFATAHVTGISALLLAQDSTLLPEEIRSILRTTAEDQVGDPAEDTPGFDIYYGWGRVNAHQALTYSITNTKRPVTNHPPLRIFPNPASSIVFVEGLPENSTCELFSSLGNRVFISQNITQGNLNVSGLSSGIYFLVVTDPSGSRQSRTVVVGR